jgi:hypothetical protein
MVKKCMYCCRPVEECRTLCAKELVHTISDVMATLERSVLIADQRDIPSSSHQRAVRQARDALLALMGQSPGEREEPTPSTTELERLRKLDDLCARMLAYFRDNVRSFTGVFERMAEQWTTEYAAIGKTPTTPSQEEGSEVRGNAQAGSEANLRDFFAGQVVGQLLHENEWDLDFMPEEFAKKVFNLADALVRESNRRRKAGP